MSGFKDFTDGSILTAAEVDGYLMRQSVMRFTTTANLLASLPAGIREQGMMAWADDTATAYMFDGTNWVPWFKPEVTQSVAFTAGSNVTVGNATVASKWGISGGLVRFRWSFTIGSTSNMQSGNLAIGLPTAVHPDHAYFPIGNASFYDTSASLMRALTAVTLGTTTSCGFVVEGGTRWSTASPAAFGTGDVLAANLVYPCSTGLYL